MNFAGTSHSYFMLIASPMWLIYDLYYKSYAGVITECMVMVSIIIAIVKYDVMKKEDPGAVTSVT